MRNAAHRVTIVLLACSLAGCGLMNAMAVDALVERLNKEASEQNAKVKIAFDPERETIITDSAPYLVRDFRLNYAHRKEYTVDGHPEQYASFRIVRYPGCNKARPEGDFSYSLNPSGTSGLCSLDIFAEAPPRDALTTHVQRRLVEIEGRKLSRVDLTIRRPDGRQAVLVFYPGRSDFPQMIAPQIASALNLPPRGNGGSDVPGPDEVDRLIASATSQSGAIKYAWLDELAQRDPASGQDFSATRLAPAEISKRGEALTRRFEQQAPQADRARYWETIGDLLALLPQPGWVRYRDRIAAAMVLAPREQVMAQKKLIHRMADMGASAGPVLARATSDGFVHDEIAIAACRVGAPVASQLGRTFLASWERSNSPQLVSYESKRGRRNRGLGRLFGHDARREAWERCTEDGKKYGPPANIALSICWAYPDTRSEASPTYLALRRMGLGGEADATMKHQYSIHWKKTYAAIGPSSPAKVCGESREM